MHYGLNQNIIKRILDPIFSFCYIKPSTDIKSKFSSEKNRHGCVVYKAGLSGSAYNSKNKKQKDSRVEIRYKR